MVNNPETDVLPPLSVFSAIRVLEESEPISLACRGDAVVPVLPTVELALSTSTDSELSASLVLVTNVANVSVDILTFDIALDNS
jgi:hypothetical protein